MNKNLREAKKNKNDEFYTQLVDIEKEMKHYIKHFENKIIYMNCDNYKESNFWKYFYDKFEEYKLNKIIATCYISNDLVNNSTTYKVEYDGKNITRTPLVGDGDFRNAENIEILKESDIVCTNPPFSLFREYVAQLIEYDKQFLIMGNNNAITYKEIFPLLKDEKMWLGYHANKTMEFALHPDYEKWDRIDENGIKYGKVPAISWFTNLEVKRRKEPMKLYHSYEGNEDKYPKYDNYDAIEVSRVNSIPKDYEGVMGVPITFLTRHTPMQFEIVGADFEVHLYDDLRLNIGNPDWEGKLDRGYVNGKRKYARILIRNKNPEIETNKKA